MSAMISENLEVVKNYYHKLAGATDSEKEIIRADFSFWFGSLDNDRKQEVKAIWQKLFAEISSDMDRLQEKINELSDTKLIIVGKEYSLSEWITIADYSKKYSKSAARVVNWVKREVIPPDCVIVVPGLNNLKLIRDKQYQTRNTFRDQ